MNMHTSFGATAGDCARTCRSTFSNITDPPPPIQHQHVVIISETKKEQFKMNSKTLAGRFFTTAILVLTLIHCFTLADQPASEPPAKPKKLQIGVKFKPEKCDIKRKMGTSYRKMHYTGTLLATGAKFDSSLDRDSPFEFTLGKKQVIAGWDQGLLDMCIGEKRKLVIPPDMAYGKNGGNWRRDPPDAALVFEVEQLSRSTGMMMDPSLGSSKLPAGHGILRMTTIEPPTEPEREPVGQQISFPVLAFSYPLKLIVTRPYRNDRLKLQLGLVYLLNYGGGLLSGDEIALDIQLDENCQLLCLSQGSTKVFKQKDRPRNQSNRESLYPATGSQAKNTAIETRECPDKILLLRSAGMRYCSCCHPIYTILKITQAHQDESKRQESWTFKKFQSFIEVYISSKRIVRENLVLQRDQHHPTMDSFTLYANLYLVCSSDNSKLVKTIDRLKLLDQNWNKTTRRPHPSTDHCQSVPIPDTPKHNHNTLPPTPKPSIRMVIIRIGSHSSILVRDWLENNLTDLKELIGPEFYKNCF
ncbi:hypothetical protein H4Q26_000679 [Puccinia striiformis f. sp. tritici PST-130]|nr:hypothetical protein H4Q26_000679 [Puccinia striiformis f. sp. tritici PST-130]